MKPKRLECGPPGSSNLDRTHPQAVASFALADVICNGAGSGQKLHQMGLPVAILTGDSAGVAKTVPISLASIPVFARCSLGIKMHGCHELQKRFISVAMVGDGVNDAPALTRSDVGISIGSVQMWRLIFAGIILVQSNPLDVVKIIALRPAASYRKMTQNLIWAAGYNVVALPLAAGVFAPIGYPAFTGCWCTLDVTQHGHRGYQRSTATQNGFVDENRDSGGKYKA